MTLKLVADNKIPYISDFFAYCDEMVLLPGEKISAADLQDADILLTRTVTKIDASLLDRSSVKWVGTATTGTDHVDLRYLEKHHIAFADAAGANSIAVLEYILCVVAALKKENRWQEKNSVVGIIGCGRIGCLVAQLFQQWGCQVLCYDPLLAEKLLFDFVSLEEIITKTNLITVHTPLTYDGAHPTFHLLNKNLINKINTDAVLINTARGGVIDESALLQKNNITLCLDVWENEPEISMALLKKAFLATPHIAGYSLEAKRRATEMLYEKAAHFFQWPLLTQKNKSPIVAGNTVHHALSIYDPLTHTQAFRAAFQNEKDVEEIFIKQRGDYALRRPFESSFR